MESINVKVFVFCRICSYLLLQFLICFQLFSTITGGLHEDRSQPTIKQKTDKKTHKNLLATGRQPDIFSGNHYNSPKKGALSRDSYGYSYLFESFFCNSHAIKLAFDAFLGFWRVLRAPGTWQESFSPIPVPLQCRGDELCPKTQGGEFFLPSAVGSHVTP